MDGAVPPQIESPKTFIGVGTRELVILGVCALLGTLSLFIPSHPAIRIGVAVLVAGLGLSLLHPETIPAEGDGRGVALPI